MKSKFFFVFLLELWAVVATAQRDPAINLSFELDGLDSSRIPTDINQLYNCPYWGAGRGSVDYYHKSSTGRGRGRAGIPSNYVGYQDSKDGAAYIGVILFGVDEKDGLPTRKLYRLNEVAFNYKVRLEKGRLYRISFYVSLADSSRYFADYIYAGFFRKRMEWRNNRRFLRKTKGFSAFQIPGSAAEQMLNWQYVEGYYLAKGDEETFAIGLPRPLFSFKTYRNWVHSNIARTSAWKKDWEEEGHCYYYIDNIEIKKVKSAAKMKSKN
jgi:hypothetical protein